MHRIRLALAGLLWGGVGCVEPGAPLSDSGLFGLPVQAPQTTGEPLPVVSAAQSQTLEGTVRGRGDYQLFELGPASAGDEWTVAWGGSPFAASPFIVALFD